MMAQNDGHWSKQKEQAGGYWDIKFMLFLFRIFPVIILRVLAFPVGFFYFLFSKNARAFSKRFLMKAEPFIGNPVTQKKCRSPFAPLRHIVSFSLALVEKLQSWGGKYRFGNIHFQDDDIAKLMADLENKKGVFVITSHLGNTELLRGLINFDKTGVSRKVPVTAIIDLAVTKNFNRMVKELNSKFDMGIISASEIGAHTAPFLEERLSLGGIVTIAGDRTSGGKAEKSLAIPFLGEEALFSQGAFYLAALMHAPVYFIFALRRGDLSIRPEYDMHVHKGSLSPDSFSPDCTRKERLRLSASLANDFASLLENYCKKRPFQWYNFYDFWLKEV
jgi:predicted LPLAT superfamily acyltransferase